MKNRNFIIPGTTIGIFHIVPETYEDRLLMWEYLREYFNDSTYNLIKFAIDIEGVLPPKRFSNFKSFSEEYSGYSSIIVIKNFFDVKDIEHGMTLKCEDILTTLHLISAIDLSEFVKTSPSTIMFVFLEHLLHHLPSTISLLSPNTIHLFHPFLPKTYDIKEVAVKTIRNWDYYRELIKSAVIPRYSLLELVQDLVIDKASILVDEVSNTAYDPDSFKDGSCYSWKDIVGYQAGSNEDPGSLWIIVQDNNNNRERLRSIRLVSEDYKSPSNLRVSTITKLAVKLSKSLRKKLTRHGIISGDLVYEDQVILSTCKLPMIGEKVDQVVPRLNQLVKLEKQLYMSWVSHFMMHQRLGDLKDWLGEMSNGFYFMVNSQGIPIHPNITITYADETFSLDSVFNEKCSQSFLKLLGDRLGNKYEYTNVGKMTVSELQEMFKKVLEIHFILYYKFDLDYPVTLLGGYGKRYHYYFNHGFFFKMNVESLVNEGDPDFGLEGFYRSRILHNLG